MVPHTSTRSSPPAHQYQPSHRSWHCKMSSGPSCGLAEGLEQREWNPVWNKDTGDGISSSIGTLRTLPVCAYGFGDCELVPLWVRGQGMCAQAGPGTVWAAAPLTMMVHGDHCMMGPFAGPWQARQGQHGRATFQLPAG